MNTRNVFLAAAMLVALHGPLLGQATWQGGDGNWNDANWSGGTGAGGIPGSGQAVSLPASTGNVVVNTPVATTIGDYTDLNQNGGSVAIGAGGSLAFTGNVRIAETGGTTGVLSVGGDLEVLGGLDVGYGGLGTLAIEGAASVFVGANLDTWWADGAQLIITGGDAEIEVGATFFLGTGATMTANINSDRFSTLYALGNVNIAGGTGTLNVNFVDDYVPELGTTWTLFDTPARGGEIPIVNLPEFGPGELMSLNYTTGGEYGQVVELEYRSTLNLHVDPATGMATIQNPVPGGPALDIDGYIIRSAGGSLVADNLTGVGDAGWLPGLTPSQSNTLLSETNFSGSTVVANGGSVPIGAIFSPGGAEDIEFEIHLASGLTLPGTVQFGMGGGTTGDFNGDGMVDATDIDLIGAAIRTGSTDLQYDLDGSGTVDGADHQFMVNSTLNTFLGDANLDGEFNSSDLVFILTAGQYEDGVAGNSGWATGDWNYDQEFTTSDFVAALTEGAYEQGPAAAVSAVPEPTGLAMLFVCLMGLAGAVRRQSR